MLVASRQIGLLDRFRVPYVVEATSADGIVRIARAGGAGAELISIGPPPGAAEQTYLFEGAVLHTALANESAFTAALDAIGRTWDEETPIFDLSGARQGSVRYGSDGTVFLPFDIDAPLDSLLQERYVGGSTDRLRTVARRAYYRARPLVPRPVQMALRRRFRRLQERAALPAWPTETSLHRLEALMLALVQRVAGEPLPWLAPWPAPHTWALVLTHDVERSPGYAHIEAIREVEAVHGLRSAWYFVPERDYRVDESLLDRLRAGGCEICLHGLRHDGRDLSPGVFQDRLPAMRAYAAQWGARGFRGPATQRDEELLQQLGLEHDSSWSDVARYEPQPGGCCSWLPFFIGNLVELPITLPQDHTLFELRGERTEASWLDKAAFLREHEGMALILTHPDYLLDQQRLDAYERFIAAQEHDSTAWHALPHEVAAWWRRRAATHVERQDGSWTVVGPAATQARLRIGAPVPPPASSDLTEAVDDAERLPTASSVHR